MATEATFDCLKASEWTQVGLSYFKNTLGHTDEMLAVARSTDGGTLPVGTVVQLIPTEASVKRGPGFSAASHDWEFFSLNMSSTGTTIKARGGDAQVVSSFNGASCVGCHGQAAPQWDLLCGDPDGGSTSHGCASLGPLATPANIMASRARIRAARSNPAASRHITAAPRRPFAAFLTRRAELRFCPRSSEQRGFEGPFRVSLL